MKLIRIFSSLAILLVMFAGIIGAPQRSSALAEMKKLEFLHGKWKGKGWTYTANGKQGLEISQSTKVTPAADGLFLKLSDKKKYPDLKVMPGNPFPGLMLNYPMQIAGDATISYDESTNRYLWKQANQKKAWPAMLVDHHTLKVGVDLSGQVAIITIKVSDNGEWNETLEYKSKDNWIKLQETTLKKEQ